jgi:hypothetical protein
LGGFGVVLGEVEEDSAGHHGGVALASSDGMAAVVVVGDVAVIQGFGVKGEGGFAGVDDEGDVAGDVEADFHRHGGFDIGDASGDVGPREPEREGFEGGVGDLGEAAEGEVGVGEAREEFFGEFGGWVELGGGDEAGAGCW